MSAYTTKRMTKSEVLALILREVPTLNNDQLESIADILLDRGLYNCRIVPDGFQDAEPWA